MQSRTCSLYLMTRLNPEHICDVTHFSQSVCQINVILEARPPLEQRRQIFSD